MDLAELAIFVEAVQVGSLAGAARRLGIGAMVASRRLAALEQEVGARLVHRTTRSLSLTTAGEAFLPHARAMLEAQANGIAAVRPSEAGLTGMLRITTSAAFGRKVVAPMIPGFMRAHPTLQVELLMTDEQVDIVARGIDVAVRIAKLRDNHLVARKLADNPRRLVASPAYLAEQGTPRGIEDLIAHQCLLPTHMTHWAFVQGSKRVRQRVGGAFSANSIEAIHQVCLGGLGIANLSSWDVDAAIRSGALVEIELTDGVPDPLAIWAVYPTAQLVPAKVRAFIDALDHALRRVLPGT
ncbi:LysR family transcriptional regulator [Sphingomonas sp. ABOLD]|uniref:LysR family transcriptional regulator n=1 Tax=Sphingomonas sp. ABOLD TaxID=1985877 RepID=UPI000F7F6FDC|nr:LysR family transcriptional regulator [Sphingomonas sp. ABOLD]RSV36828.1 LysR family transcriptional regulator [Sphingomonas sp. ABOLD]